MRCTSICGALALWLPLLSSAAENAGPPALEGIVCVTASNLPPFKRALLRIPLSRGEQIEWSHPILREGDATLSVEVRSILPEQGKVVVVDRPSGAALDLYLTQPLADQEPPGFQFRNVKLWSVIELLQDLSGCSVLAPVSLSGLTFDLLTPAYHSSAEAADGLKEALRKKELIIEPRGDKFLLVVASSDGPILKSIPDPPISKPTGSDLPSTPITSDAVFPPGLLKFSSADLLQVLEIYQELAGRTVLRPDSLVQSKISMRSQSVLDRREAIWMMNATLRLAGVATVNESDKFVFTVPPTMTNDLPHFDPKRSIPNTRITETFPPGLLKFSEAHPTQFLALYAQLIGRKVGSDKAPFGKISIRSQTSLSFPEAVYAFEAMAAINNLAFDLSDPENVSIIRTTGLPP
jgi:hypothetical protein